MDKYTKSYTIILDDTDVQKFHLQPVAAIKYLEDAYARYTASKGMGTYDLKSRGQYWVINEINIFFHGSAPFWSEDIKVELWFSEISRLKLYVDFRICCRDKIFAKGNTLWLIMDSKTKRPALSDKIAEKFSICRELMLGEHIKIPMPPHAEQMSETRHKITMSDIDFNGHVNNKIYLNIAGRTMPEAFRQAYTLEKLHVRFNKETFLDDVLNCTAYKIGAQDNKTESKQYAHIIDRGGISVCDLITDWRKYDEKEDILHCDLPVRHE